MENDPEKEILPPKKETFMEMVNSNKLESLAYLALIVGILLSLFSEFWGGAIVGIILGLYYAQPLFMITKTLADKIQEEGVFKSFVAVATLLILLISVPGLFIATAIGAGVRIYLNK